jgi:hypothetical protein
MKVNVIIQWADGFEDDFVAYDDVIDVETRVSALEEGYLVFAQGPEDDGTSGIIINLAQTRMTTVTALPAREPEDEVPER